MSELDPFETRFAAAYRRYLAEAPVGADPVAVARRVAAAAPRRQGLAGFRPFGLTPATAWVLLLLAALLLALLVGGLLVGAWRPDQAVVVVPQSPATSPTPAPTARPSGVREPVVHVTSTYGYGGHGPGSMCTGHFCRFDVGVTASDDRLSGNYYLWPTGTTTAGTWGTITVCRDDCGIPWVGGRPTTPRSLRTRSRGRGSGSLRGRDRRGSEKLIQRRRPTSCRLTPSGSVVTVRTKA